MRTEMNFEKIGRASLMESYKLRRCSLRLRVRRRERSITAKRNHAMLRASRDARTYLSLSFSLSYTVTCVPKKEPHSSEPWSVEQCRSLSRMRPVPRPLHLARRRDPPKIRLHSCARARPLFRFVRCSTSRLKRITSEYLTLLLIGVR